MSENEIKTINQEKIMSARDQNVNGEMNHAGERAENLDSSQNQFDDSAIKDGQNHANNLPDNGNSADESFDEYASDNEDEIEQDFEDSKPNWLLRTVLIVAGILLFVLLLIFGIVPRINRNRETKETAEQRANALPIVNFAKAKLAPETNDLVLPGTLQAVQETAINARASGYISRRYADIGDRVQAGQVLAELDTPELDEQLRQAKQQVAQAEQQVSGAIEEVAQAKQQLNQARAGLQTTNALLKQARTNENLAAVTSRRSTNLAQKGLVSQQEADQNQAALDARKADTEVAVANIGDRQANIEAQQAVINTKQAAVNAQQANVRALQANVRRLEDLQGFRRITAPFSGVITARNIDVGGLVSGSGNATSSAGTDSATSTSTAQSASLTGGLFRIAKLDAMRVYINVPQTFAAAIAPGLMTQVQIKELPQQQFEGRVSRTSNALDPNSRTLLTEVLINNESGQILPGMYAQIKVAVPRPVRALIVPSSALISRASGTSVIIINPDNTIHYQNVVVGRDFGKQIEILDGIEENATVVTNPTDSLQENAKVEAREAPPENQQNSSQPANQQNQQGITQTGKTQNSGESGGNK